jgi:RES domain-containing protein
MTDEPDFDPAHHLKRGTNKPSAAALRQARWRSKQGRQVVVMLPPELHAELIAYVERRAMDAEDPLTVSQTLEHLIRSQLLRKR